MVYNPCLDGSLGGRHVNNKASKTDFAIQPRNVTKPCMSNTLTHEMPWGLPYCLKSLSDVHTLFLVEVTLDNGRWVDLACCHMLFNWVHSMAIK